MATSTADLAEMASRRTGTAPAALFTYPVEPDSLKIFTEHGLLPAPRTNATDVLSYLLSKTSLQTQKVTHSQIQEVGERLYQRKCTKFEFEKHQAVKEAVNDAEKRAAQRLQNELSQALRRAELEKQQALEAQKSYYETMRERIATNRDRLEQEREEKLVLRMNEEKKQALHEQWQHAERLKAESIERVLTEQRKKLRSEAALRREKEIADALRVAREKFKDKLENEIQKTKRFCERIAQDEIRKMEELHQIEVIRLRERIVTVERQLEVQMDKMRKAQRDYWEMENEYCHFLDYTSHKEECPSGFLISPKKRIHGKGDSNRDQNVQTRLISLDQGTKTVQTDVQIRHN